MITSELYDFYRRNNYKIIFSAGYSPQNKAIRAGDKSEEKIYKAAKAPVSKWKEQKDTKNKEEIESWIDKGGWIAAVLPAGYIALDVDSKDYEQRKYKTEGIKDLCAPFTYGIHQTKNGLHLIFKSPSEYKANQDTMTKAGFLLTYRPGTITNIIVEPTPDRTWLRLVENDKLSVLPDLLRPIDTKSLSEVRRALSMQIGYSYRMGFISGNDHIDLAFMHFLVNDCGNEWPIIEEIFQEIYVLEYDEAKTRINYQRANDKTQKCKTIDTLLKVLHEKKLFNIIQLINNYGFLSTEGKNVKFIETGIEPIQKSSTKTLAIKFAESYSIAQNIYSYNKALYARGNDFVYAPLDGAILEGVFAKWLTASRYSSKIVGEMIAFVKQTRVLMAEPNNKHVLMRNGLVLNLETFETRLPFNEEIFFYKANGSYDANSTCPRFMQFLREVFPENTDVYVEFLQRYIGSILLPHLKFEVALIFRGEGSNGKSVLMDVIEKVIGEKNISHVALESLNDKNERTHLIGKLLNMNAEISSKIVIDDNIVKTLVSGETMTAKRLYQDSFEFKPFCKFIYASNNAVTSLDKSHGYEKRILFIDFNVNFDIVPHKKDINLRQKLFAEIDGIFTWVVNGARQVLLDEKLIIPELLFFKSKNEHKLNNPIFEFASEHLCWSLQEDAKAPVDLIYKEYRLFCDMNGYKYNNKKNFAQNLKRILPDLSNLQCRVKTKRGYRSMWLLPTYYNKRNGEIVLPDDARTITESCEKYVTEMSYKEYLEWRKETKGV